MGFKKTGEGDARRAICIYMFKKNLTMDFCLIIAAWAFFWAPSGVQIVMGWGVRQMLLLAHAWRFALFPLKFTITSLWILSYYCTKENYIRFFFNVVQKRYATVCVQSLTLIISTGVWISVSGTVAWYPGLSIMFAEHFGKARLPGILYAQFLALLAQYPCQRLMVLQESCKMGNFL